MRSSSLAVIALCAALVALVGCEAGSTPATIGGPQAATVATPAATTAQPFLRPYPEGRGDTDGLSRDPDDCDRGCIGGNPD
jgi:hypothetical protein